MQYVLVPTTKGIWPTSVSKVVGVGLGVSRPSEYMVGALL